MRRALLALFRLRPPTIERVDLEVLHEAAHVQRMFTLMCYGVGRPDMVDVPTFGDFIGPITTGAKRD